MTLKVPSTPRRMSLITRGPRNPEGIPLAPGECRRKGLALAKIHTKENGSNMLTKVSTAEKLDVCERRIGLASHPMPE